MLILPHSAASARGIGLPHAFRNQHSSTTSIRRSPASTLAIQLCETSRRAARARCESPAPSRAAFSSARTRSYSLVCVDFSIAPIIGTEYNAPKLGADHETDFKGEKSAHGTIRNVGADILRRHARQAGR